MKIDCARCPVRARACDGCMMQVLFGPVTSEYGLDGWIDGHDGDLVDAIDVFVDTELVSIDDANEARRRVTAGGGSFSDGWPGGLRAV